MSLLSFLLLVFIHHTSEPTIEKVQDEKLISLMNSLENNHRYTNDIISVSIFKKSNPPGSAGFSGGHEISHSYYLAVSEYDEYPAQSLFLVGGFYNPKYQVEVQKDHVIITVEYGAYNDRRTTKYKITLAQVSLLNP